ncbi:MAG: hypothetical protein HOP31_00130 [Ignavibacteria bacterium]|nr:hypothetical protein [Ignavibacteria bacterium]
MSELIDTSLQLNSKRNNVIHCYWMANSGEKPNEYLVFRLKKDISKLEDVEQMLGGHRIFYSINELKKLSEDIKQNYLDFHKVVPNIPVKLSKGLNDISRYQKYNDEKGKL